MNKLRAQAPTYNNLSTAKSESVAARVHAERSRRLIVLIPPETECTSLTRRICTLANQTNSDIQLLGLYRDATRELSLQRELITASALIRDAKIYVETKIEMGTDWLAAMERNYREGDTIVCIADQSMGFRGKPLSQIIQSTFKAPIYILTDAKPRQTSRSVLSQVVGWLGLIGIIAVFFVLEIQIVRIPEDWSKTFLSILILIPEIASIMFWNSLF